jgi:methylated-DNA-[protein]-cysteine S-methyltransferase
LGLEGATSIAENGLARIDAIVISTRMETTSGHYTLFDTTIGVCGIAWSARGLTHFQLPGSSRAATEARIQSRSGGVADEPPPSIAALIADIRRYFAGEEVDFSAVAVDLSALNDFQRKLYQSLRSIGWGRTTTYGDLARALGCPDARDIGQAMGKNPVPVIIPCHRVLAAGNKMGGFSAYGGTATKQKLLALEGVHLGDDAPRLPGL